MSNRSQRNIGLDVIRSIACFSVIAVHFFLNTGFYEEIVEGPLMIGMVCLRSSLMISIPLFLMLSGYLLCHKTLSAGYYLRIVHTLFIYVCVCLLFGTYRVFIAKDGLTLLGMLLGIFSFSTAYYSWYMEMYLGLFLLIPFLNVLYNGLKGQKQKQWLVLTFLLLTAAPSMVNIYRFNSLEWWLLPSIDNNYQPLIPDWWTGLYPLTYYFIGCYLREFPLGMKRSTNAVLLLIVILIGGSWNVYRSYGSTFVWGPWENWGSVFCTLISVLIFSLLEGLRYEKMGVRIKKIFTFISEHSLGTYLISGMYDDWIYDKLNIAVPIVRERFPFFLLVVPLVFVASLLTSSLFNILFEATAAKLIPKLEQKLSAK